MLVSVEDYERLEQLSAEARKGRWAAWQQASKALTGQILARRQGEPIDVDQLWQVTRAELEARNETLLSG